MNENLKVVFDPLQPTARRLRDLTGRKHALLAGRAAAGIVAALRAWGLRDQTVLLPANTCYIVLWAVLKSGNRPRLVDIDPHTGNITPATLSPLLVGTQPVVSEAAGIEKPAAIIPAHMYGLPAPMAAICAWARANNSYVIEDAALALGAQVDGRPAGAWGDVSVFSFGQGKIADNELGGAVLTDDDRLAAEIERLLSEMPLWSDRQMALTNQWNALYWALHQHEAANPRLLELYPTLFDLYGELTAYRLPAAYWRDLPGLLHALPANLRHRATLAALYDQLLFPRDSLSPPPLHTMERGPGGEVIALWRYPLLVAVEHRDGLLHHLWENGLHDATRWYPPLRHMAAALAPNLPQPPTSAADRLGAEIINLRLDPGVDAAYVRRVAGLIRHYFDTAD